MKDHGWLEGSSVRQRLSECLEHATASGKALANFMLANISKLPFETSASVSKKVGVSELTVGRFCRSIGYSSFKELKENLKDDISDSPWLIGDRLRDFQARSTKGTAEIARSLELEIAAIVRVYELVGTEAWNRAVKRIARAPRVFIVGFQTERGLGDMFAHLLRYLRDDVYVVDLAAGNFAEVLLTKAEGRALVMVDTRRYSHQSRLLAQRAHEAKIPVTLITDLFCDWAETYADEVFAVPTEFNLCWDSTVAMASLMQLMLNSVFTELGPSVEGRLNSIAGLYDSFVGHTTGSRAHAKRPGAATPAASVKKRMSRTPSRLTR